MVNHHIEGNGKRGFVTGHHVGRRVAHEDHVDTRGVDDPGHRIIVRSQHGDLLAALFHLRQTVGGHSPDSTFYRHSLLRTQWIYSTFHLFARFRYGIHRIRITAQKGRFHIDNPSKPPFEKGDLSTPVNRGDSASRVQSQIHLLCRGAAKPRFSAAKLTLWPDLAKKIP